MTILTGIVRDPAPQPEEWWTVDHYDTDSSYHNYCGACKEQIPDWLIRYEQKCSPPYISGGEPMECEGCGKTAGQN